MIIYVYFDRYIREMRILLEDLSFQEIVTLVVLEEFQSVGTFTLCSQKVTHEFDFFELASQFEAIRF